MLQDKVIVTGGAGFLGQSVVKKLLEVGFDPTKIVIPRKADIDLTKEANVIKLYEDHQPDIVVHLAAEVGGIGANMENPGRFFYANMSM